MNWTLDLLQLLLRASQVALVVKNPSANVGDPGVREDWEGWEDPPEEEILATHSSTLAWKIPDTVKPGGLHPWGHRVGHN